MYIQFSSDEEVVTSKCLVLITYFCIAFKLSYFLLLYLLMQWCSKGGAVRSGVARGDGQQWCSKWGAVRSGVARGGGPQW